MDTTTGSERWYVRCEDCLAVACLDLPTRKKWEVTAKLTDLRCAFCGGPWEVMGRVERQRLQKGTESYCKCDERCVSALGPHCSCACGGANHGAQMAGFMQRAVTGGVPTMTAQGDAAKHHARAEEYRQAVRDAEARIARLPGYSDYQRQLAGAWLAPGAYGPVFAVEAYLRALYHAAGGRSHKGRLAKLSTIAAITQEA